MKAGIVRKHGGSLVIILPADSVKELDLSEGSEVEYYVRKITDVEKDEARVRQSYPDEGAGQLFLEFRGKEYLLADFPKIFYHQVEAQMKMGDLVLGQDVDSLPTYDFWTGRLFQGRFRTSAFVELGNFQLRPIDVLHMIDGVNVGKLVITSFDGKERTFLGPRIELSNEVNIFDKPEIYNLRFSVMTKASRDE